MISHKKERKTEREERKKEILRKVFNEDLETCWCIT